MLSKHVKSILRVWVSCNIIINNSKEDKFFNRKLRSYFYETAVTWANLKFNDRTPTKTQAMLKQSNYYIFAIILSISTCIFHCLGSLPLWKTPPKTVYLSEFLVCYQFTVYCDLGLDLKMTDQFTANTGVQ